MSIATNATFTVSGTAVSFAALSDGLTEDRESAVGNQHVPGSSVTIFDRAGRMAPKWTVSAYFDNATDWGAMAALLNQEGTLAITGLDTHTAIFSSYKASAPVAASETRPISLTFEISD